MTRALGSKAPLYIFDLDGTLANINHRLPILGNENLTVDEQWRLFYAECPKDLPNEALFKTLHYFLYIGCDVWIWTGRSNEVEPETREWLQRFCEYFEMCSEQGTMQLRMRDAGDFTPDHELKQQWLHGMSKDDRSRLLMAFEDRASVVEMYRRNGVMCCQVAEGDIESLNEPTEEEIVEKEWGKAFNSRTCPAVPMVYIAKSPYSSIGKPATTDHQRRLAERMVENDEAWPTVSHINQVRFIIPKTRRQDGTGAVA